MVKKSSSSKSTKLNSSNIDTTVQFFRLNNGEDIVSEVQKTENGFMFINPCKVVYMTSGKPGYLSISFMQWVFSRICDNQAFEIDKKEILFNVIPSDTTVKHYWESVEHFTSSENKQKLNFDTIVDDEDFTVENADDAIDMLKEYFSKIDKGKLH
jgi:hypothetical protein